MSRTMFARIPPMVIWSNSSDDERDDDEDDENDDECLVHLAHVDMLLEPHHGRTFSVETIMERFLRITDLYSSGSHLDEMHLRSWFANIYDASVTAFISTAPDGRSTCVTKNYEEIYRDICKLVQCFQLQRVEVTKESSASFRYLLVGSNSLVQFELSAVAHVNMLLEKIVQTHCTVAQIQNNQVQINLIKLFRSFVGDGRVPVAFQKLVEEIFDKQQLVVSTSKGDTFFDDFYSRLLEWHKYRVKFEILGVHRHEGGFEINFRAFSSNNSVATFSASSNSSSSSSNTSTRSTSSSRLSWSPSIFDYTIRAMFVRELQNGKVVHIEPLGNDQAFCKLFYGENRQPGSTSGEVVGDNFPLFAEFCDKPRPLPGSLHGRLMGGRTALQPSRRAHHFLKVSLQFQQRNSSRKDVDDDDDDGDYYYKLFDSDGHKYANGAYMKKSINDQRRWSLKVPTSSSGGVETIACCSRTDSETYRICAAGTPIHHQVHCPPALSVASSKTGLKKKFYPWFLVQRLLDEKPQASSRCRSSSTIPWRAQVLVWNGESYEPLWTVSRGNPKFLKLATKEGRMSIVIQQHPNGSAIAVMSESSFTRTDSRRRRSWDLSIAPGVDPAALLCVAVIVQDLL